uniref:HXXEE domain-containing protein n=1 Tax=Mycobacterium sp. HUMS_1102779 TaxID=3383487 RepID=UPI003899AB64
MWEWFERYWSSVGLGAAIVLLLLVFLTNTLRDRPGVSRWRDPVWLAWLMVAAYLLHNFEEYGIDAKGRAFHFPVTACAQYGFDSVDGCPLAPSFFVAVNIPFIWIALPIAARWCRRNPAVGLTGLGLLFTNALSHIGGAFTPMGYSPGTLTAAAIFIPLSVWVFVTFFGKNKLLSYPILVAIVVASILAQAVLLALLLALSNDSISLPLAIIIQSIAPVLLLLLPLAASRKWPPAQIPTAATAP